MDSPIRQYQKQKDYLRHKLFRKIKRRKRALAQQEAEAPLREMRRRVLKRFKDGKDIKRFDDGEDIVYESPDIPINISYVPKSNVRVNPETGGVLTRDNQEGALMLPEVEIRPKRRLELVYRSDLDLSNPISKRIQNFSRRHYWDPILGAPARLQASIDNGSNPLVALGSMFGVPSGSDIMSAISPIGYDPFRLKTNDQILDFWKKKYYYDKIHGKPDITQKLEFINGELVPITVDKKFAEDVVKGLPFSSISDLMNNSIGRNTLAFAKEGVSLENIKKYSKKANQLLEDVNVGRYSGHDYEKAGWENTGGFYDLNNNFISINMDSKFPVYRIEKHEGRHLLDRLLDDNILMPEENTYGIDFDVDKDLISMQRAKQKQNMVLGDAYDRDFITIPESKYAGDLKGYSSMGREAVTTNRDSREVLLSNITDNPDVMNWSPIKQNKLIDNATDELIFQAVATANGYGRRYIERLSDEGKLTAKKAKLFREAMKYVGGVAIPIGMFAPFYSQELTNYNSGKDSGIHINPKNRGKFNALKKRTGKTTEQLTHSKNPLTRKRAIFALNARKWHHK